MKYVTQFLWILLFSFLGEVLQALLPFPIPASIYGLVLLFAALCTGLVKLDRVRETGHFLISLMPLLFVAPVVNILECWDLIAPELGPIAVILVVSTFVVFAVSGHVTQFLLKGQEGKGND